jgi:hypothetical protein
LVKPRCGFGCSGEDANIVEHPDPVGSRWCKGLPSPRW